MVVFGGVGVQVLDVPVPHEFRYVSGMAVLHTFMTPKYRSDYTIKQLNVGM